MELEIGVRTARAVGDLTFTSTETDAIFLLLAHLPGLGKDDIEIQINEARTEISISGGGRIESLDEVSVQSLVSVLREVEIERFCEVFPIPDGVDFQRIDAEFDEDEEMLVILLPKLAREEVATSVIGQVEEESEEVSCDVDKEQIGELEKSEPSDVDREPDKAEMEIDVLEKKEEEEPAPEPSAKPLASVEPVTAPEEEQELQQEEETPTIMIPHQLEEEAAEEELEEERVADVEMPMEDEKEENFEDEEILTAEMSDQIEPDEKLHEEEIPTIETQEPPPKSPDSAKIIVLELLDPSKVAESQAEEEEDQSPVIEATDPHHEQEIPPDYRAAEAETTDPHQDEEQVAQEQEIPNVEAPEIKTADPSQEQEPASQEEEIPNVEAPEIKTIDPSQEQEPASHEEEIPNIEAPEIKTTDPSQEQEPASQEEEIPNVEDPSREQELAAQEQKNPATETVDEVPEIKTTEKDQETVESQGKEQGHDLKQEHQNAAAVKTPDQSSDEDSEKEQEGRVPSNEIGETEMVIRDSKRRRARRSMPLPPTPSCLVAGSAFIFSLVVLMFHFLKERRQKPQK